jgi:hypothetical protein
MDVLLACPALIDAVSVDQVRDYLEPFMESINYTPEDDVEINDVTGEDEDQEIDEELEG